MSDELEFLRTPGTGREAEVGRRDGRAGGVCCIEFREGNGGGFLFTAGIGLSSGISCSVVRRGSGGGLLIAEAARVGRGGSDGVGRPSFRFGNVGGTTGISVAARTGGGGGGRLPAVEGALKFFCWFRAAMRSASVLNCGSSTSAISNNGL